MVKIFPWIMFLVLLGAPGGGAQIETGDLVVGCLPPGNGLFRFTRTGIIETILDSAFNFPNAVDMWADNIDMAVGMADVASSYVQNTLLRVSPDGVCSTVALIQPGPPNALDMAEDGKLLVFPSTQNAVLEVVSGTGTITTLCGLPAGSLNAGSIDRTDGGLLMGVYWQLPQGGLVRVDAGGILNTLAWNLGRINWVESDLVNGDWVVTRFDAPEVLRVGPTGVVTSLTSFRGANTLAMDQDGSIWIASGTVLLHITSTGVPIATYSLPGSAAAIEIYGGRTLVGTGATTSGSTYTLNIQSLKRGDGGQPYFLVASTTLRPALSLAGGTTAAIGMSPLLMLSIKGMVPFLSGFQGTLNPFGQAAATIQIPAGLGGLRIYVTGVVINQQLGQVSTVLNTIGLTIK